MKTPSIQPGKAIVIIGQQGSGRSELALKIAATIPGTYMVLQRICEHKILMAIRRGVGTIIIEDAHITEKTICILKRWISARTIRTRSLYSSLEREFQAPQFILTTSGDLDGLIDPNTSRRFTVVRVDSEVAHG